MGNLTQRPRWFRWNNHIPTCQVHKSKQNSPRFDYLSIHQSINPSIHQSINPSIHQSINPSIHQSINPSIHQSIYLSIYLSIYQSIYLPVTTYTNRYFIYIFLYPSSQSIHIMLQHFPRTLNFHFPVPAQTRPHIGRCDVCWCP